MCSGSEAGSYLRRIDSCITQIEAHGPCRTCNQSKKEEKKKIVWHKGASANRGRANMAHIRQSRPDSGLDVQVKVLKKFKAVSSQLGGDVCDKLRGNN